MINYRTKPPTATLCPRCGRIVLDGLDDGIPYRLDPLPVTIATETVARNQRGYSYSLIDGLPRLRDVNRVKRDLGTRPVLLEHDCAPLDAATVDPRFIETVRTLTANAVPADADHDALLLLRSHLGSRVYADAPPW